MKRFASILALLLVPVACGGEQARRPVDEAGAVRSMNRGLGYLEDFVYAKAAKEFERALEKKPGWIDAEVNLAVALLNIRGPALDRALKLCEEILRQDPGNLHALFISGVVFRIGAQPVRALKRFDRVLQADPTDPATLFWRGMALVDLDRNGEALESFNRAITADPQLGSAWGQKALRLRREGEEDEAEKVQKVANLLQNPPPNKEFPILGNMLSGSAYQEIGKYAMAIRHYDIAPEGIPPSPVTFERPGPGDLADYRYGGEAGPEFALIRPEEGEAAEHFVLRLASRIGPGVVLGDADGDGDPDVFLPQWNGTGRLFANDGKGHFTDVTEGSGIATVCRGIAGAFFDADGDGDQDLYVTAAGRNVFYENRGDGTFADATERTGLAGADVVSLGVVPGDFDHEGDIDLFVLNYCRPGDATLAGAPDAMFRNNRDGTFTDVAGDSPVNGGDARSVGALTLDVDGDLDADLLVIRDRGPAVLWLNDRMWKFRAGKLPPELQTTDPAWGATAADIDRDGQREILVFRGPAVNASLFRVAEGGRIERMGGPLTRARWRTGVFLDADLDGRVDLVGDDVWILGEDGRPVTETARTSGAVPENARGIGFGDLDGDGDLDRLVATPDGARVIATVAPAENHWLALDLIGREALQPAAWAAMVGPGQEVELRAGRLWQPLRARIATGFLSTIERPIRFGLGRHRKADVVRMLWPDRVLQVEAEIAADRVKKIEEVNRKPDSCPMLFVWDGRDFRFVSDFLGVGGVGFFVAPGVYGASDPDEYVKIGDWPKPVDGDLLVRVHEPLEEIAYMDRTTLVAVDHPAGWEVYPNERFVGDPALFPEPRIYAVPRKIFPRAARDRDGNDILSRITKVDRIYAPVEADRRFTGLAKEHVTVLDFTGRVPEVPEGGRLVLFIDGWIEYGYSHTWYAARQAGFTGMMPKLEVLEPDGTWKTAVANTGAPAGLPKGMTLDVTGIVTGERPVFRLRTNLEVFWDRIFLGVDHAPGTVTITRVAPRWARLRDAGYPREYSPDGRQPLIYDYEVMDPGYPYKNMTGDYTRFGNVLPLLARADDRYVIMGRGEEIALRFPVSGLPAPPEGWSRTWILHAVGWCKDMDPYTAFPDTVEPLPFRGMSGYPPPAGERYPDTPAYREYRKKWQTRHVYGR